MHLQLLQQVELLFAEPDAIYPTHHRKTLLLAPPNQGLKFVKLVTNLATRGTL